MLLTPTDGEREEVARDTPAAGLHTSGDPTAGAEGVTVTGVRAPPSGSVEVAPGLDDCILPL